MKSKIFAVYDSKVAAYAQPFHMESIGAAIRAFADTCEDPQSMLCKHPHDFTLFQIGEYDDTTGTLKDLDVKVALETALAVKARRAEQMSLPNLRVAAQSKQEPETQTANA